MTGDGPAEEGSARSVDPEADIVINSNAMIDRPLIGVGLDGKEDLQQAALRRQRSLGCGLIAILMLFAVLSSALRPTFHVRRAESGPPGE